jgi:hypothetical protein
MAGNRNEYLHGTGIDFTKIPTNIWWQEFWAQAEILLTARGAELEELIGGDDRLTTARKHLRNHESYLEDKWTALQESALQRRDRHEGGLFSSHEAASWESESPSADMASTYREPCECPACGELGWIGGEDLIREMEVDEHADGELHAFAAIGADCFACDHCHLTLTGADLLTEAKLDEFVAEVDPYDYYEPEYGND